MERKSQKKRKKNVTTSRQKELKIAIGPIAKKFNLNKELLPAQKAQMDNISLHLLQL
jgi:hypothetical protein